MKKQLYQIVSIVVLIASIFACQSDVANFATPSVNAALASKTVKNQAMANTENNFSMQGEGVLINGSYNEGGMCGPGAWYPGWVFLNGCTGPGVCIYAEGFGHGPNPLWEAKFIGDTKIRLESVVDVVVEDVLDIAVGPRPGTETTDEDLDVIKSKLKDFVSNHYNIPTFLPFETEANNRLVESAGLPLGTQLYTIPGDYEIIKDTAHPKGYFDMDVFIQREGGVGPPPPPPTSGDCYTVWNGREWRVLCR